MGFRFKGLTSRVFFSFKDCFGIYLICFFEGTIRVLGFLYMVPLGY